MITDLTLAACAEMIFTELPILERVRHIDDLGFQVEIGIGPDTTSMSCCDGSPVLLDDGLMLDIYHAQIGEGNLVQLINKWAPYIGEVQVADVPGRCEPGTGEINYSRIAQALRDIGYVGTVGLEAWASSDSELALERFRAAVTLAPEPSQDGPRVS
jgi:hydroxypyruvate isomerase